MRRMAIAGLVAMGMLATAGGAHAAGTLHPGDYHETEVGGCTLGFLFDHGGVPHFSTAAHCVHAAEDPLTGAPEAGGVGSEVRDVDGDLIGTVAFIADPPGPDTGADRTEWDFAFIRVDPSRSVSPNVRGHATMPSGTATSTETTFGDRILFSGYGIGFEFTAPTRQRRFGALEGHDPSIWFGVGSDVNGDSGGPVMHAASGEALGLVSRLCIGGCTSEGPTVEGIAAKAAAGGFPVALRHSQ